jgi:hypothetical protein
VRPMTKLKDSARAWRFTGVETQGRGGLNRSPWPHLRLSPHAPPVCTSHCSAPNPSDRGALESSGPATAGGVHRFRATALIFVAKPIGSAISDRAAELAGTSSEPPQAGPKGEAHVGPSVTAALPSLGRSVHLISSGLTLRAGPASVPPQPLMTHAHSQSS